MSKSSNLASKASFVTPSFERVDTVNPILTPRPESHFSCPLKDREVRWEHDHTFNPAAVVRKGEVFLFYRAEDNSGTGLAQHTSRIGLAKSRDGLHFKRLKKPILYPQNDAQQAHEWPGGCEDPRLVEREDGLYVMTYTQWNRKVALVATATSRDLLHWKKHGYAFAKANFDRRWSKSGSIVCRQEGDRLLATKIQGKYWMYWGEGHIYAATSDDLIDWKPLLDASGELIPLVDARPGKFDSALVEPGPPALLTTEGILLLYNGKNSRTDGDPNLGAGAYAAGQLLFNLNDPTQILARSDDCFFKPERPFEKTGQYKDGTVFIQGLVHFKNRWFLYYGTADSAIGVAVAETLFANPAAKPIAEKIEDPLR